MIIIACNFFGFGLALFFSYDINQYWLSESFNPNLDDNLIRSVSVWARSCWYTFFYLIKFFAAFWLWHLIPCLITRFLLDPYLNCCNTREDKPNVVTRKWMIWLFFFAFYAIFSYCFIAMFGSGNQKDYHLISQAIVVITINISIANVFSFLLILSFRDLRGLPPSHLGGSLPCVFKPGSLEYSFYTKMMYRTMAVFSGFLVAFQLSKCEAIFPLLGSYSDTSEVTLKSLISYLIAF